jgi:hypothetical protein
MKISIVDSDGSRLELRLELLWLSLDSQARPLASLQKVWRRRTLEIIKKRKFNRKEEVLLTSLQFNRKEEGASLRLMDLEIILMIKLMQLKLMLMIKLIHLNQSQILEVKILWFLSTKRNQENLFSLVTKQPIKVLFSIISN